MSLGRSKDFCMWLLLWFLSQQSEETLDTAFLLLWGRCTGPALGKMIQVTDVSLADVCHLFYCAVHMVFLTCRAQLMYRLQICCPCVIGERNHTITWFLAFYIFCHFNCGSGVLVSYYETQPTETRWGHIVRLSIIFLFGCRVYFVSSWTTYV